jgi:25S rRNA (uracil2634-N3)-methyltransferase
MRKIFLSIILVMILVRDNIRDNIYCSTPRAKARTAPREGTLGYRTGMNVLTVGDGDLSFSLAIARLLSKEGKELHGQRLIATSYELRETLESVYPNFRETVEELESFGAHVEYEVDATRLSDELKLSDMKEVPRFHRIVWNFPCTAISQGQDGQNAAMEANKETVRRFVHNARHLLEDIDEIHMLHKTKPPYNQWKLEEVATESIKTTQLSNIKGESSRIG